MGTPSCRSCSIGVAVVLAGRLPAQCTRPTRSTDRYLWRRSSKGGIPTRRPQVAQSRQHVTCDHLPAGRPASLSAPGLASCAAGQVDARPTPAWATSFKPTRSRCSANELCRGRSGKTDVRPGLPLNSLAIAGGSGLSSRAAPGRLAPSMPARTAGAWKRYGKCRQAHGRQCLDTLEARAAGRMAVPTAVGCSRRWRCSHPVSRASQPMSQVLSG
jgi:hypothetical protein